MQLVSTIYGGSKTYLPKICYPNKNKLANCILGIFSPKQTTRPDSIITCCREVIPHLRQAITQDCWKVFFISRRVFSVAEDAALKNGALAIEALNRLESAIESQSPNEVIFSHEEIEAIQKLLSEPLSDGSYFKFNAYLNFLGKARLWKTLKGVKEVFLPIQEDCVISLQRKMENIERYLKQSTDVPFNKESKLTPKDVRLLVVASLRKKMLQTLSYFQIRYPYAKELYDGWSQLEKLGDSETVKYFKDRAFAEYKCGRVFFYDRCFNEIRDYYPFSYDEMIKHVFYSRVMHAAVVVKNFENEISLSHANGATFNHAIHPVRFPLTGPLGYFAELNILPLLPSTVSLEHKNVLQTYFTEAFIRLASEEHPNITLKWKLLLTFLFGHKSLISHDLSDINLNTQQTHVCTSYVGVIFLKAIHEVNQQLQLLGYKEKIRHPFGKHEILDRVDILQLLYYWKQLKVMKEVSANNSVSKFFTAHSLSSD